MRSLVVIVPFALAGLLAPLGAAELSPAENLAARKIYEVKCAKCHKFYEPSGYAQPEWDEWMLKMSKKSKLKPDQRRLLTEFLADYRRKAGTAGAK